MLCCTVSVSILSSELDLAQVLTGLVKRVDLRSTHIIAAFSPSRLRGTLAEISPEKKISLIEEDYFLRLGNYGTCQSI